MGGGGMSPQCTKLYSQSTSSADIFDRVKTNITQISDDQTQCDISVDINTYCSQNKWMSR